MGFELGRLGHLRGTGCLIEMLVLVSGNLALLRLNINKCVYIDLCTPRVWSDQRFWVPAGALGTRDGAHSFTKGLSSLRFIRQILIF